MLSDISRGFGLALETEEKRPSAFGNSVLSQVSIAIRDRHAKERLCLLTWFHLVDLRSLRRIIVPPQPDHLFRELRAAIGSAMLSSAEREMEIISRHFQCIGHTNVV